MADDSDIRAVLREHGVSVPARGKLSAAHRREYDRIRGVSPDGDEDQDGEPDWDSDERLGESAAGAAAPPRDSPGVGSERRPKRPRSSGSRGIGSLFSRDSGGKKKRGKAKPRVPVDRVISRFWEFGARVMMPVSGPVSTTLRLQSPIAGLVLEDSFRETLIDRVLQPVARAEERGEKVLALVGPPLLVAAIEAAQGMDEPARQLRLAFLEPLLVEALTLWVKIADDKLEQARERVEADAEIRAAVQELLEAIFPRAEVVDVADDEQAGQEQQPQAAGQS